MARIGNKGTQLEASSKVGRFLMDNVSKAALADLYLQALALQSGCADCPVTLEQLQADADQTLLLRGDKTISQQIARYQRAGWRLPAE
jgi:hypothetical protein